MEKKSLQTCRAEISFNQRRIVEETLLLLLLIPVAKNHLFDKQMEFILASHEENNAKVLRLFGILFSSFDV